MIGKGLRLCLRQSEKAVIHFDFFYKKKKKYKHICKHILGQSRQTGKSACLTGRRLLV